MNFPSLTTLPSPISQECDYGTETGLTLRKPMGATSHPLEASEYNYEKRQENIMIDNARRDFGIGFALHLKHEMASVGCSHIGNMSFLTRHNAMLDSLTGKDLSIEFSDYIGTDREFDRSPHLVMEHAQVKPLFH